MHFYISTSKYHTKYREIENNSDEKIHFKKHVVESLSHYLGYENYTDFVIKNKPEIKKIQKNSKNSIKFFKISYIVYIF